MAKAEQVLILEPSQELKFRGEGRERLEMEVGKIRYFSGAILVPANVYLGSFVSGTWGD